MGKKNFECTPWGMPTFSIFGWQKPCYLLQDGYADTFKELMETTSGRTTAPRAAIRSARTAWCTPATRPSAVNYTFGSIKGLLETAKKYMFPSTYPDEGAQKLLNEWKPEHPRPLVQIQAPAKPRQRAAGSLGRLSSHGNRAAGTSQDRAAAAAERR